MGVGIQGAGQDLDQRKALFRVGDAVRQANAGDVHFDVGDGSIAEMVEAEKAAEEHE